MQKTKTCDTLKNEKFNREIIGAARIVDIEVVKRETGVNPVRSRHCIDGVSMRCSFAATDVSWEGSIGMLISKPGNLPVIWYRNVFQTTSN